MEGSLFFPCAEEGAFGEFGGGYSGPAKELHLGKARLAKQIKEIPHGDRAPHSVRPGLKA